MRVPRALAADLGGARETDLVVTAAGPVSVREVLDVLAQQHPALARRVRDERGELRRFVNVYVSGEEVRRLDGQATAVPAGTTVEVVQSVAGG
ncbi:MoaD/ThiS family protein [Aquipuribacter nitratireducens]|uniref:MoaD/ThiS family protein n=1 Tax=Aquipuribacter nitratireducens TaxID=650104 RepID=A0ABW0GL07_9MICO